jgi:hypothetical protein
MKLDLYAKTLLTVIALCLIWICIKDANFIASAHANKSVAPTPVAPTEVVSFQLAWNERTNTGLFKYKIQNEEKFRSIRVRALSDLAGWAALVSQKPLNADNRGWIYTGAEPVREQ